ncbi:MAG TPA: tetratricopeptide repeat-containing glycosyltransferase family protein [Rhodopila sp.]|nr:tetratricopeptide repeat-containing glycosyltransferase family protein [Rhodopila sp.]
MNPYTIALHDALVPLLEGGRTEEAIPLLKLAIQSGADDPFFLYALGNCQFIAGDCTEAAVALTTATRIDPTRAEAFNDLAATLFVLGRDAEALACLRRSLTLRPDLPEAQETDAMWLLRYGRFHEGWRKYEARFRTRANRHLWRSFAQPNWEGEKLGGRTILLHAEQGLGDALQFARYAPLVAARGGRVILQAYAEIVPLLTKLPGVATLIDTATAPPRFDVHCSLLSLPRVFGTDLDSIPAAVPYLTVPEARMAHWRHKLGPRRALRVGVAWSGNPKHRDDARRSIPFDVFATLLTDRPDIELHVLQTGLRRADRAGLQDRPWVRNHADVPQDFGDAGALVSLMDVVISVDTSIAHLAGALDRPVWLLLANLADWRWMMERDDTPWYPSMRLLRQPERGDWASVLSVVAARLGEMLP